MKTLTFVWGFVAFTILGLEFLSKTETFTDLQDFESNFDIVNHPEDFLSTWSANEVRSNASRVFQAAGEGIGGSNALGIQAIGSFDAEIYKKTTTKGINSDRVSLKVKTKQNGSGNRPVSVFYSFSIDGGKTFDPRQQIGDDLTFRNEDTPYQEYEFFIPESYLEQGLVIIKMEVKYGKGSGSATRLFIDDFALHGVPASETDPLQIVSIEGEDNGLIVHFNQAIQFPSTEASQFISLNHNYGIPQTVLINDQNLLLEYADYIYSNQYELTFTGLSSLVTGEELEHLSHSFDLLRPTPAGALVINEFMADPNAKGLVPERSILPGEATHEYLEIFNATDKAIWLKGLSYNGGLLEEATLPAGGYTAIVSSANKELFRPFGKVLSATPFRSLPNTNGFISIIDAFGNVVDSLSYSREWYHDSEKQSGGWALERVNPVLPCSDLGNWKASVSTEGGTPGKINSVFDNAPDERPFLIHKIEAVSDKELTMSFSKPIDQASVGEASFTIDGEKLSVNTFFLKSISLTVPFALASGTSYKIEIINLLACSGTPIQAIPYSFLYDVEGPVISRIASLAPDELLVYFDKAVDGSTAQEAETYQINQEAEFVKSARLTDSATVHLLLKDQLKLNNYHSLGARNLKDRKGNRSIELKVEFFLDDHLDTAVWAGPNLLDLYFRNDLDSSSIAVESFWLDKKIGAPVKAFQNPENLKLVHLVFDQNLPQNTPGTITVQNLKNSSGDYINTHKKTFVYDTRAISIKDIQVFNDTTIIIVFNKPINPHFASIKSNYFINNDIEQALSAKPVSGDSVMLKVRSLSEGTIYTISVSGLEDAFGIKMTGTINRNISFDLSGPVILEAVLISPYEIQVSTDEAIQLPNPDDITVSGQVRVQVRGLPGNKFIISTSYELIENTIRVKFLELKDLNGNASDSVSITILNNKISIGKASVVNEDQIQLAYTAKVDPATGILPGNYVINGQHPKEVIIDDNEYEITLSLSKPLLLMDSVFVEINTIKSKHGKESHALIQILWYDDQIEDLFVINPQLIQALHKAALDKSSAEEAVFTFRDQTIQLQPIINQSDPRVLQLALSQALVPDKTYELVLPSRLSVDQKHIPGSTRTVLYDKTPPRLVLVESLNENEILVYFDEALDPILSLITSFYSLNGEEPIAVMPGNLSHQVSLAFSSSLAKDQPYNLVVKQIEDLHRNAIEEARILFYFDGPVSPSYREIIINEIMAAPREGLELPNVEYIELYNTSQKKLFLGGLSLANSRSSAVLPRAHLSPGEFLILTPVNGQDPLRKFGNVLPLHNWPTLLNNGDEVRLLDRTGTVLDELSYTTASYGSSERAQGGFSLEIVNPFAICPDNENLRPSASPLKGTPGQTNSVFDDAPDRSSPELIKANIFDDNRITLEFSKKLNDNLKEVKFNTLPSLTIESHTIDQDNPKRLVLTLQEPLKTNTRYHITVNNLRDCSGNLIDPQKNKVILTLPLSAGSGDIALSEILFNPKSGVPKFVEIYNRSANFIDLKEWKLANLANEETANRKIISSEQFVIDPFSFLVFTTDAVQLKLAYPQGRSETFIELPSLPSYPQGRGTVVLLNPQEDLIERFDYDEKFHHSLLDEVRGISLERLSIDHEPNDPKNWHSSSAASGYATPGFKNSHSYGESLLETGITIAPEVFVPDSPGEQNFTTISYKMDKPGYVATLRVYSVAGQLIKELCQNDIWGSSGFYIWDGTNLTGSKVRPGYYIVWVEVLNLEGSVVNIKKTVVVGSKF